MRKLCHAVPQGRLSLLCPPESFHSTRRRADLLPGTARLLHHSMQRCLHRVN
jgi:hypothetical protein